MLFPVGHSLHAYDYCLFTITYSLYTTHQSLDWFLTTLAIHIHLPLLFCGCSGPVGCHHSQCFQSFHYHIQRYIWMTRVVRNQSRDWCVVYREYVYIHIYLPSIYTSHPYIPPIHIYLPSIYISSHSCVIYREYVIVWPLSHTHYILHTSLLIGF